MVLLYHYTDKPGIDDIYKRNEIKEAPDGLHGAGVYFTEFAPTTPKKKIAQNIWGTSDQSRTRFWFKLRTEEYPKISDVSSGERNLWLHAGDLKLHDDCKVTLYHYTDLRGKDGINATGVIRPSMPSYVNGVSRPAAAYLTEVSPEQFEPADRRRKRMQRVFGTGEWNKEVYKKTKFWFRFRGSDLPGVRREKAAHHGYEWVYEGEAPIRRARKKPAITEV